LKHLEGLAVGGEGEERREREGDGEEAVDELDVLAAEDLGPRAGLDADELLDGEVERDLLGLLHEADGGGGGVPHLPGAHGGEDEAVDVRQERRRRGAAAEAGERERVEALVRGAAREEQGVAAEQRGDGGRVAAADGAALGGEEEAVEGRVGGEDGALAEDVRREHAAVPRHALVDERLRVGRLVRGNEPQRLPDERQARAARRKPRRLPRSPRPREEPLQRRGHQDGGQEKQRRRRRARVHGFGWVRMGLECACACRGVSQWD
jgi:hypothetical protein